MLAVQVSFRVPSGYEEDSFLLAWDDKDSHDPDTAVPLSPKSTQTMYEMEMPTEPQKCYLYLQDGPDGPPTKVSSGVSVASGGDSVGLASSISTTTSAHALNNATSNNNPSTSSSTAWPHYSNKSDTGKLGLRHSWK